MTAERPPRFVVKAVKAYRDVPMYKVIDTTTGSVIRTFLSYEKAEASAKFHNTIRSENG